MEPASEITNNVIKPFSYAELLGRVRALLRRGSARPARGAIRVGDLTIDPVTRAVRLAGVPVHLSAKEVSARFAGSCWTSRGQEVPAYSTPGGLGLAPRSDA